MSKLSINRTTRLCMSLSARPGNFGTRFHNHLYEALGLDYVYKAFGTRDLDGAIGGIRALGIRGCAVSMPFKEVVIPMLDSLDPSAQAIGSVNTIVNSDGHLHAYNTDYIAIVRLVAETPIDREIRFLLTGSGGMAKAVASALRDNSFTNGTIVARNQATGTALADACGYGWAPELGDAQAGMLINVTPVGMEGGPEAEDLAFPKAALEAAKVVVDVVALPSETPTIRAARALGKRIVTGAEIQTVQAVEQFILYTGQTPTPEQIAAAAAFAQGRG
ncbi:shikimate 5-dehydrogenase [Lichenicoccus sp.]|uniref:shikimate 5-dehydrogenase n=1 Tax=Lichenicoccus sp. TaxID=2781899 RepID=UPI003D0E7466